MTLDFSGDICHGGGSCAQRIEDRIQSYGDVAGQVARDPIDAGQVLPRVAGPATWVRGMKPSTMSLMVLLNGGVVSILFSTPGGYEVIRALAFEHRAYAAANAILLRPVIDMMGRNEAGQ